MKVIFMGTPDFAAAALRELSKNHQVLAVVTQPDKQKGRGKKFVFSPVKALALDMGLTVLQPEKIKSADFIKELEKYSADIFVVAAYGQILSEEILNMPKYGSINIHASLLPKYRGAAPIQWAIINGEEKTGVTIMQMDKGLDTGDMLLKSEVKIEAADTYQSLHDKLSEIGAAALIDALSLIEKGEVKREKQDDSKSCYASMIKKEMGLIDFTKKSDEIINLIRGLNPWPSAFSYYCGELLKIWGAKKFDTVSDALPGTVVEVLPKEGFAVKTGDASILVQEVQSASGKRMSAADYLRGHDIKLGDSFTD